MHIVKILFRLCRYFLSRRITHLPVLIIIQPISSIERLDLSYIVLYVLTVILLNERFLFGFSIEFFRSGLLQVSFFVLLAANPI